MVAENGAQAVETVITGLSTFEWLSILGALAWLPPIIFVVYKIVVRPKLTVVFGDTAEIGYTSLGPIVNLNFAIRCQRKEALVERIEIAIRHESGQSKRFLWTSLGETLSQAQFTSGESARFAKNIPAVALSLPVGNVVERLVQSNDAVFRESLRPLINNLFDLFRRLEGQMQDDGRAAIQQQILSSQEYQRVIDAYRAANTWQEGQYEATVEISVSELREPLPVLPVYSSGRYFQAARRTYSWCNPPTRLISVTLP